MIGQTLGHYRILEKVGAGGMGVVYRAHDEQLERDVAVKVLPRGTLNNDAARKHFRKEALALAKLNHPNIETIYEFNTQDGTDFLVMEYVPGKTLADRLISGTLPEKEAVILGMQIAAAMEEAHSRGIVHRDLKPRNIALTDRGQAKVLDFGLARLLPQTNDGNSVTLTDTQAGAGTLPYMSPEQLQGEPVDARGDIYTAGAVLYEMIAGRRAFSEELPSRLIDSILHQPPVPPRALNPRISPELERVILKCLDKDPARRFQTAKELLVDLRRLDGNRIGHAICRVQPVGRRRLRAARQRRLNAGSGIAFRQPDDPGEFAIEIDFQRGVLELLLDAGIRNARDVADLRKQLVREGAAGIEIGAGDLNIERRRRAKIEDLGDDIRGKE